MVCHLYQVELGEIAPRDEAVRQRRVVIHQRLLHPIRIVRPGHLCPILVLVVFLDDGSKAAGKAFIGNWAASSGFCSSRRKIGRNKDGAGRATRAGAERAMGRRLHKRSTSA